MMLFDASLYYESIGRFEEAIRVLNEILVFARNQHDLALQWRAHNNLAASYPRICDFNAAFVHCERTYRLALLIKDPIGTPSALVNTAAVLDTAGLNVCAKELALRTATIPFNCERGAYVQLLNASNGISFSYSSGDSDAAAFFYKILSKIRTQRSKIVSEVTWAYCEAATSEYLIAHKRSVTAANRLSNELKRTSASGNVRIAAILLNALTKVYLSDDNDKGLANCKSMLIKLAQSTKVMPLHHEDVLSAIVKISDRAGDLRTAQRFSRALRSYLLTTRHHQFFDSVARQFSGREICDADLRPVTLSIPQSFCNTFSVAVEGAPLSTREQNRAGVGGQYGDERYLRSPMYEVAEDWAVAAEFFAGGEPSRCFTMGEICRLLALQQRIAPRTATLIGLATRLRGIGKIATAHTDLRESDALSRWGYEQRQAAVGASLLSGTSDEIIQIGSRVAGSQFEWWNGAGSPSGLRGDSIPVEARICAVSEAFLQLVRPRISEPWAIDDALKQLRCMAGVQLDPAIVDNLIKIIDSSRSSRLDILGDGIQNMKNSGILQAKSDLFGALELHDDVV